MLGSIKNLPIISQIWSFIRKTKIIKKHKEVAGFWHPVIDQYYSGQIVLENLKPKKEFQTDRIIWQYWGQGCSDASLPEVVKHCFESVDQYKADYLVIRIDDSNYKDYVDLPEYVIEKLEKGIFKRTFFSDLLRLSLLSLYGGVWLDATILLTAPLDEKFKSLPYFMYQRDNKEQKKSFWENSYAFYWGWDKEFKVKVLNSIIYAEKGNDLITDMLELILYYWRTQNEIIDYFFFQILYNELVEGELKDKQCQVVSDVYPHILQTKFNGVEGLMEYGEALNFTSTHKMSYFDADGMKKMNAFLQNSNKL